MTEKPPEHASPLRQRFLAAARGILRDLDTPLDLRKVAERAGKSRTAPYLEFGKESEGGGLVALKMAVAADGFAELTRDMVRAGGDHRGAGQSIRRMAEAYLRFARREPRLYRLMFGEELGGLVSESGIGAGQEHREADRLLAARMDLQLLVERMIARGRNEGVVRLAPGDDAGQHTLVFWAMLHGTALLMLDGQLDLVLGPMTANDAARLATEHLLIGLGQSITESARALRAAKAQKTKPPAADLLESRPPGPRPEHFERFQAPDVDALEGFAAMRSPREAAFEMGRPAMEEPEAGVMRRARAIAEILQGARLLWVDDHPARQRYERRMLEEMEVEVQMAPSTEAALLALQARPFDVVISDIARGAHADEGVKALPWIRKLGGDVPVIFYVAQLDPARGVPVGAFGITNRPDELFHLVMDALERRRGGGGGS